MEQSGVAGTKRKPGTLSQQPPKLKQPPKSHEGELPRNPYPMPSNGRKRSISSSEDDDCTWEGKSKKRKIAGDGGTLRRPPRLASFPSFDSKYPPANQYRIISPVELMKVWESILDQVDWSEVLQEAGGREKPQIYRDVFKTIVHSHIEEQKQEQYRKDMTFELSKRGDEDTDTENGNDSSEDGGGFRHFDDNAFLESDESGYGSEDYTDDETETEGSDDVDQEDDDCEAIDELASV